MTAERDLLDRATELFPAPEPAFERLLRRRDRKRRYQRIAVTIVALVVAAAAIGNVIVAFRSGLTRRPVDRGLTAETVRDLTLAWHGHAPHTGVGWVGGASAGEGVLLVATNSTLVAFDEGCAERGRECTPRWTATGRFGTVLGPPDIGMFSFGAGLIADGFAYVPGNDHLYAFDLSCRSDGGRCEPTWTSRTEGDFSDSMMSLVDGEVLGTFRDPETGIPSIYAMATACGSSVCDPAWVARGWVYEGAADDHVFATSDRSAAAFAIDCRTDGGSCAPSWTVPARDHEIGIGGHHVYVVTDHGLAAYAASCSRAPCEPEWVAPEAVGRFIVVGPGIVLSSDGRELIAYQADCEPTEGECRPSWVARGMPIVVEEGLVIAERRDDAIVAYPAACRSDGGRCSPAWISPSDPFFLPSDVQNGILLGRSKVDGRKTPYRAAAYELDCGVGGVTCGPVWVSDVGAPGFVPSGPIVEGDHVFLIVATFPPTSPERLHYPTLVYAFAPPATPTTPGAHDAR